MKSIQSIVHIHIKDTNEDLYFGSVAAMFDDTRVNHLLGMSYKTYRNKRLTKLELYENEFVVVHKGVLLVKDHSKNPKE